MLIVKVDVAEVSGDGVIELLLKLVVTPAGAPEIVSATAELKPFREVTVIVDVPKLPCWIVKEVGDADIEKSGAGVICSVICTVCVNVPFNPVTVRVDVPDVAEGDTETARVEVAELPEGGVTEAGLRVAVTPLGAPETESSTTELKPFREATDIVEVPEAP
jgi:hypothetical protein